MTQINDIITDENDLVYFETVCWCRQNNATLIEIEPKIVDISEEHIEINKKGTEITKTEIVKKRVRQFRIEEIQESSDEEKSTFRILDLQKYLNDTDWYVSRFSETGVEIPEEIKTKRQEARDEISKLRDEKRLAPD